MMQMVSITQTDFVVMINHNQTFSPLYYLIIFIFILYSVEENESLNSEEQGGNEVSYSISHSISDELIPFSDSPQISRYGA